MADSVGRPPQILSLLYSSGRGARWALDPLSSFFFLSRYHKKKWRDPPCNFSLSLRGQERERCAYLFFIFLPLSYSHDGGRRKEKEGTFFFPPSGGVSSLPHAGEGEGKRPPCCFSPSFSLTPYFYGLFFFSFLDKIRGYEMGQLFLSPSTRTVPGSGPVISSSLLPPKWRYGNGFLPFPLNGYIQRIRPPGRLFFSFFFSPLPDGKVLYAYTRDFPSSPNCTPETGREESFRVSLLFPLFPISGVEIFVSLPPPSPPLPPRN